MSTSMLTSLRTLALTLLITLTLSRAVAAQDDAVLAGLSSSDRTVVLGTLEKLEPIPSSTTVLRRVIELAQNRGDGAVRQRARAYVEGLGARGLPKLLAAAREGGRPGITALRLASRIGGPKIAPELVPFLDHAEFRLRSSAAAALSLEGHAVLDVIRARHEKIRKELATETPEKDTDLKFAETFSILSGLEAEGIVEDLRSARKDCRSPRLFSAIDAILGRDHPETLRDVARKHLASGDRRNEDLLLDFFFHHGAPADSDFALSLWRERRGESGVALTGKLERIEAATRDWLGGTGEPCRATLALHDPRANVAGREKIAYDRPHRRALRGVHLRLPTETMLTNPSACEIVATGDDTLSVRFHRKETHRFGIGDLRGKWIYRFGFDVARFELKFDPVTGRPLRTTCYDPEGRESGKITYAAEKNAVVVTVRSGTHELIARYESKRLDTARIQDVKGNKVTLLAAARLIDVVTGAEKTPEGR